MSSHNYFINGSIGLTILQSQKEKKKFFILYDIHDNEKYCSNNKSFFDSYFFSHLKKDKNICAYVEEYYNNDDYKSLWSSRHVAVLKNFVNKYKNVHCIYPTDIRLLLVPISLELIDDQYNDMTVHEFFKNIIELKKNITIKDNPVLMSFGSEIENRIDKYIIKYENYTVKKYFECIGKHIIDNLINNIMELYTIYHIYLSKENTFILYYGISHSFLFLYLLNNIYDCTITYSQGIDVQKRNNIIYVNNIELLKIINDEKYYLFDKYRNCFFHKIN